MSHVVARVLGCLLGFSVSASALAQSPPPDQSTPKPAAPAKAAVPATEQDRVFYALGAVLSHNLEGFALSEAEFNLVRQGFADGFHHKPETAAAEASIPQLQVLQRSRGAKVSEREKAAGQAYADKAAKMPGANKTNTGLVYRSVTAGSGASPTRNDTVKVHYEGRLIDGTVFDSSRQHGGQPVSFQLTGVIPCWTEALQLMKVGGKSRIVCPSTLAYGERGSPPKIKPGSTLEFDVELLDVTVAPAIPPASQTPPPNSVEQADKP